MKKHSVRLYAILSLLLFFSSLLIAQTPFRAGVKAGANISTSTFKPYFYNRIRPVAGFQAGFTAEYKLAKTIFLQSELVYTTKGIQYDSEDVWIGSSNPPVTYWQNNISQHYAQIPLLLAFKPAISRDIRAVARLGYYNAYGIVGKIRTQNRHEGTTIPDESQSVKTFSPNSFKRFDHGFLAGVGIEKGHWSVGLNYDIGNKDIFRKEPTSLSLSTQDYKNRSLSLTLGYFL